MKIPGFMKITMAFLLAAGTAAGAWAKAGPWSQELSLEAGAAYPTAVNNFSDSEKMGPMGGARYLFRTSEKFAFGLQGDYYSFAAKNQLLTSPLGGQMTARSQDDVATVEVVGRYSFLPKAKVVPYFHTGVGATYFRQVTKGEPAPGSGWPDTGTTETRQVQDTSSVGISYSAGFGAETNLTKSLVLGLETAWRIFGVSQTTFGTSTIGVPSVSLRLGWRFGPDPIPTGF